MKYSYEDLKNMRFDAWGVHEKAAYLRDQLIELMESLDGNVIVPRDPTEYMLMKGADFQATEVYSKIEVKHIYQDMIDAFMESNQQPTPLDVLQRDGD